VDDVKGHHKVTQFLLLCCGKRNERRKQMKMENTENNISE
jgi:hypothetical protein